MDKNTLIKTVQKLEKELNDIYTNITIEKFFDEYKDSDKPLFIYIQAYTPGFNDGDPCEHTCWTTLGSNIADYYDEATDLFNHFKLEEQVFENKFLFAEEPDGLETEIELILEEALHRQYGTDWHVLIKCFDGKVEFVKEDYYCGY